MGENDKQNESSALLSALKGRSGPTVRSVPVAAEPHYEGMRRPVISFGTIVFLPMLVGKPNRNVA